MVYLLQQKWKKIKGCIIQICIVAFPIQVVIDYWEKLLPITTEIIGWMYDPNVMSRGTLLTENFPTWQQDDIIITSTVKSWCKMLYAHHKK